MGLNGTNARLAAIHFYDALYGGRMRNIIMQIHRKRILTWRYYNAASVFSLARYERPLTFIPVPIIAIITIEVFSFLTPSRSQTCLRRRYVSMKLKIKQEHDFSPDILQHVEKLLPWNVKSREIFETHVIIKKNTSKIFFFWQRIRNNLKLLQRLKKNTNHLGIK